METLKGLKDKELDEMFEIDLIVWKLGIISPFPVAPSSFEIDLIVWKRVIR